MLEFKSKLVNLLLVDSQAVPGVPHVCLKKWDSTGLVGGLPIGLNPSKTCTADQWFDRLTMTSFDRLLFDRCNHLNHLNPTHQKTLSLRQS